MALTDPLVRKTIAISPARLRQLQDACDTERITASAGIKQAITAWLWLRPIVSDPDVELVIRTKSTGAERVIEVMR